MVPPAPRRSRAAPATPGHEPDAAEGAAPTPAPEEGGATRRGGRLELRLLGPPRMRFDGRDIELPQPKILALLAYLAITRRPCPREELTELLWGVGRGKNLRMALYNARRLPGADAYLDAGDPVALAAESDLAAFEDAVREGAFLRACAALGSPGGVLLAGSDGVAPAFDAWLEEQRRRVATDVHDATAGAAREAERRGDLAAALAHAHALADADPFDEAAQRLLMSLEHARGHTEAALWHFERLRRRLRDELGSEPAPETRALFRDIERGLHGAGERARRLTRPEEVAEGPERLLGREALVGEALGALEGGARVLLHGLGGIGKTAVAAAVTARWLASGRGTALWATAAGDDAEALADTLARALEPPTGRGGAPASRMLARATDKPRALRALLQEAAVALLVLDDARNPYVLARALEAVPEGVPVLVTARRRTPGLRRLAVERLAAPDADALLELHAGRALGEAGARLAARLGAHPFALRVAGARLAREATDADALLAELGAAPHTLRLPPELAGHGPQSVASLLEGSLEQISDAAFEAFLAAGALFAPSVTPALLGTLLRREEEAVEEALFELQSWALSERIAEPGSDIVRYRMHDLAYAFARHNRSLRPRSATRACLTYARHRTADLAALDAELPNLLGAAAEAAHRDDGDTLVDLVLALNVDGPYLSARGHSPRTLALLTQAADAARERGRSRDAHQLWTKLGNAQRELLADHEAALASYRHARALATELGDGDREAILTCLEGVTLHYLERPEADGVLARAEALAQRSGAAETRLHVLQNLGGVAGLRGDFAEAHRYSRAAVKAARALVEERGHERVGATLVYALLNLGEALRRLRRTEHAAAPLEEALTLATRLEHTLLQGFAWQALGELDLDDGDRDRGRDRLWRAAERYRSGHAGAELRKLLALLAAFDLQAPPASDDAAAGDTTAGDTTGEDTGGAAE